MSRPTDHRKTVILEALYALDGRGTPEQILGIAHAEFEHFDEPMKSIGKLLYSLQHEGEVQEIGRGLWQLAKTERHSPNGSAAAASASEGERVKLADFQANRAKQTVTLYQSPLEITDVVAVWVYYQAGQVFKVPLAGGLNVCPGPDVPKWSPGQETNYGIKMLRFIQKDGKSVDYPCDPKLPITFNFVE